MVEGPSLARFGHRRFPPVTPPESPARYSAKIAELATRFDLSPSLLEALVWQESRWRENAVSPVGARGLAQLMPGTARYLGVDPSDPFQNLEGGGALSARTARPVRWQSRKGAGCL